MIARARSPRNHLAGLAVCLVLAACGASDRDGSGRTDRPAASTLRILFESDDYVLGPARDDWPKFLMFEPLVRHWGTGAQPALATSWEHSDDFRTWTFHLRDDVRWHDGAPVTAHDVAYSLELFRSPDITLHSFALGIASISVPDEHTLALTFKTPRGPTEAVAGWPVYYPKHLIEDLDPGDFFQWEFWKRPVGNGPYRYVRSVPNTMVELAANPDYYAGPLAIDRLVLRLSTANPVLELTSGNVDAVYYLTAPELAAIGSDDRFRTYVMWVHSEPQAIHWNLRHPFLADAAVRRALAHAIDRRELARLLFLPDEMPLTGGFLPDDRADELYAEGWDQGPAFDPELAVTLLEEAGWGDPDGDGVRERGGIEARFTLLARQGGILSTLEAAVLLQDQLAAVGVAADIRPTETSLYRDLFRAGDFDATVNDVRNVPAELLRDGFFGEGTRIGYQNPEVERLLEAITQEADPTAREALFVEVNEVLSQDMPFTWLFPYFEAFAAHRKVRGLRSPDRSNPIGAIREIWIEDDGGDP